MAWYITPREEYLQRCSWCKIPIVSSQKLLCLLDLPVHMSPKAQIWMAEHRYKALFSVISLMVTSNYIWRKSYAQYSCHTVYTSKDRLYYCYATIFECKLYKTMSLLAPRNINTFNVTNHCYTFLQYRTSDNLRRSRRAKHVALYGIRIKCLWKVNTVLNFISLQFSNLESISHFNKKISEIRNFENYRTQLHFIVLLNYYYKY